jgi:hypothetical protein
MVRKGFVWFHDIFWPRNHRDPDSAQLDELWGAPE